MNRIKPSFWLFLGTKFPPVSLRVAVMFVITFPIIFRVVREFGFLPYFVSLFSLLTVAIILRFIYEWKKYQELSSVFETGNEVIGEIGVVHFKGGAGFITYKYQYQQENYHERLELFLNKKTKNISIGQQVVLYVNSQQPKQAFIRDLYLNTF